MRNPTPLQDLDILRVQWAIKALTNRPFHIPTELLKAIISVAEVELVNRMAAEAGYTQGDSNA